MCGHARPAATKRVYAVPASICEDIQMKSKTDRANTDPRRNAERLTYRLNEVAEALGVSRRLIEKERAAGKFPQPDIRVGRVPLWARSAVVRWIAEGGSAAK